MPRHVPVTVFGPGAPPWPKHSPTCNPSAAADEKISNGFDRIASLRDGRIEAAEPAGISPPAGPSR